MKKALALTQQEPERAILQARIGSWNNNNEGGRFRSPKI